MPTAALHTLGCKVNQYETQKISDGLASKGFRIVGFADKADVYIINTCTVTQIADAKSRYAARTAVKRNPGALVVMTGCYAEASPNAASSIDGISLIIGNRDKALIADKVMALLPPTAFANPAEQEAGHPGARTRALVKIQDGCNQFCSYCAVPLARPVMWSKPAPDVILEARRLADIGYREIVLTGIRTGLYEDESINLTDLIAKLTDVDGIKRIRISSIEATDVPEGMLELMSGNPKVCRHLHIPLQSGDDFVLKRMNRPYTSAQFIEFVRKARLFVPGIGITTDIMVGFPGETEEEFSSTCRMAETAQFARAHVFRYSPRPGTVAAGLPDVVSHSKKGRRSAELTRITSSSASRFADDLVGKTVPVLIEGKGSADGMRSGLTDSYVRVPVRADTALAGRIVDVVVYRMPDGRIAGNTVDAI